MRIRGAGLVLWSLVSCAGPAAIAEPAPAPFVVGSAADAGTSPGDVRSATAPPAPSAPALPPLTPDVIIDETGVGDVRIGALLPRGYLADPKEARARYEIRWIADAQPFEAFRVGEPGRLAAFDGPFTTWAKNHVGPLEPSRFVEAAVAAARSPATPVRWIVIEEKGLFTKERIGVGSTYAALAAAYPGITIVHNPEWFDSRPTCSASSRALAHVQFLLASCGAGGNGDVVRIVVSRR